MNGLPDNFVIVDGLLTVEPILQPSWLIRRRLSEDSMTGPYVWVATIAQAEIGYEVKGYLARDEYPMVLSERRAMKRIVSQLGFSSGGYGRADKNGAERVSHAFEVGGKIAQKSGD